MCGNELKSCSKWFTNHKLPLHLAKTYCILFVSKRKLKTATKFQITFNDHVIKSQCSVKHLSLQIDHYLSGAFSGQYR